jgi:hypothetical protein
MSNTVEVPRADFELLKQEAALWRYHVQQRLLEGYIRQDTNIECIEGEAKLKIHDAQIVTPYGTATMHMHADGTHIIDLRTGSTIKLANEVLLKIS